MPGLAGLVGVRGTEEQRQAILASMLSSLQSEPCQVPSGRVVGPAALGRVSLEIFNPGPQPVSDSTGPRWALLEGELYDLPPLDGHHDLDETRAKHTSQAEHLLRLHAARGEHLPCDLNGSFNFVSWDAKTETLTIINDRFGTRPIYYSCPSTGGLAFASEIKALLTVPGVGRTVDGEAVLEFLSLRHCLGDKTPFIGIYWLPPASILTFHAGRLRLESYWLPTLDQTDDQGPIRGQAAEVLERLRRAVARCLDRTARTGVLLSGGLDSRLLVAAAPQAVRTFTRSVPGCDDARLAQQVAQRAGAQHHFLEIVPDFLPRLAPRGVWLTDGLMSCVDFYELSTLESLSQEVDVVLFGIPAGPLGGLGLSAGLDELDDQRLAERLYAARACYLTEAMQARLLSPRFYREVRGAPLRNLHQVLRQLPPLPSALKAQLYFLRQYGPRSVVHGPVLTRSRVETCFPFADAELLDSTCRVPAERRRQRQLEIEMLKLASPELAGVPWQFSGLPAAASTPRRVRLQRGLYRLQRELNARTRGAWPVPSGREQVEWAQWFRTSLRPWLETILLGERTLARGYFNPQGIRDLIGEHVRGARDHTNQFGVLLTFELWQRLFVDGEGLSELPPILESGT